LASQVSLGFEFQAFFHDRFPTLSSAPKTLCPNGFAMQTLSLGLLIVPSTNTDRRAQPHPHPQTGRRLRGSEFVLVGFRYALPQIARRTTHC
jgi:hypothetical protein